VSNDIQSKSGISDDVAAMLNRLYEGAKLGGTIDQDVTVDIANGHGQGGLDKTTYYILGNHRRLFYGDFTERWCMAYHRKGRR
jgi:hypothetical protein